jgi:hypothetical protein
VTNIIASYSPTTTRSDGENDLGFSFQFTGVTGTVPTELGAWMLVGNVGAWVVRLINLNNTVLLATATVTMGGGTTPGSFNYSPCVALASMTNGSSYTLMVNVPASQTYNEQAPITVTDGSGVVARYSIPNVLNGAIGNNYGNNNMYAGVDMVFGPAASPSQFLFAG